MECLFFCAFGSGCHVGICKQQVYGRYCWTRQPARVHYQHKLRRERERKTRRTNSGTLFCMWCICSSKKNAYLHRLAVRCVCITLMPNSAARRTIPSPPEPPPITSRSNAFFTAAILVFRIVQNNETKKLSDFD